MNLEVVNDVEKRLKSENRGTEIETSVDKEDSSCKSPPPKRLKQARLPFSPLVQQQEVSSGSQEEIVNKKQNIREGSKKSECTVKNAEEEVSSSTEVEKSGLIEVDLDNEPSTNSDAMEIDNSQESGDESGNKSILLDDSEVDDSKNDSKLDLSGSTSDASKEKKTRKRSILSKEERVELKRKRIEDREKRRIEREEVKKEKEKLKEEAKLQREKKRIEALTKKKEEEMKKEERKVEREEKKRKREEEKQEVKAKKLEEKQAKEEKKRQQELEKSLHEAEEEQKIAKVKAAFVGFFVKKDPNVSAQRIENTLHSSLFKAFEVKENQRVAPVSRVKLNMQMEKILENNISKQEATELYLQELREKKHVPKKSERTWPCNEIDNEIQVIDNQKRKFPRAKLLKFHENVRPPYWGTWRKSSEFISPRNPLKKDTHFFDYEVDSDEEWEEEEPGESLSGTEDEAEKSDGEYEVDNDFFVPHGYLSDEEKQDDDAEILTPDGQKTKLRLQEMEFLKERKEKFSHIKPKLLGPIWCDDNKPGDDEMLKFFKQFEAVLLCDWPIRIHSAALTSTPDKDLEVSSSATPMTSRSSNTRLKSVPIESMPDLIRLIHGNKNKRQIIVNEFLALWEQRETLKQSNEQNDSSLTSTPVSKKSVLPKIVVSKCVREIATWGKSQEAKNLGAMWTVKKEILNKYSLTDLSINNEWQYLTKNEEEIKKVEDKNTKSSTDTPNTPSILDALNLKSRGETATTTDEKNAVKETPTTPKPKNLTLLEKFLFKKNTSSSPKVEPNTAAVQSGAEIPVIDIISDDSGLNDS